MSDFLYYGSRSYDSYTLDNSNFSKKIRKNMIIGYGYEFDNGRYHVNATTISGEIKIANFNSRQDAFHYCESLKEELGW